MDGNNIGDSTLKHPQTTNNSGSSTLSGTSKSSEKLIRKRLTDSLQNINNAEGKVSFLIDNVVEYDNQNFQMKKEMDSLKRENGKIELFEKKITSLERQLSKTEMTKSKLEELCSKALKDEKELSLQKIKALQASHSEAVNSIKQTFQQSVESKQDHAKRVADVERLSVHLNQLAGDYDKRLKDLKKLYDDREEDMNKMAKAKEEELLIMKDQVEAMKKRVLEVFEENVKVKNQLLTSEERVQSSMESELALRKTLDEYSSKYSKLLKSFSQSNKSFDKVKNDMTRMNSNLIRVESEAKRYKVKVDESAKNIEQLNVDKCALQDELAHKERQLVQMQELCRRLRTSGSYSNELECKEDCTNSNLQNCGDTKIPETN